MILAPGLSVKSHRSQRPNTRLTLLAGLSASRKLRVYATSKFCRVAPNALARAALLQPAASGSRMVRT